MREGPQRHHIQPEQHDWLIRAALRVASARQVSHVLDSQPKEWSKIGTSIASALRSQRRTITSYFVKESILAGVASTI